MKITTILRSAPFALLAIGFAGFNHAPAALISNLETYYDFNSDSTAPGDINDQSVNSRDGSGVDVDDGTPVVEDVLLYVDGTLQTTFTSGPGSPTINTSGSNEVTIGSSQLITGDDRSVRGLMDEVGIWSRALSEQEIQTLASGTPIIPEPSTLTILGFGTLGLIFRRRRH